VVKAESEIPNAVLDTSVLVRQTLAFER
jgi:hypothetical protein